MSKVNAVVKLFSKEQLTDLDQYKLQFFAPYTDDEGNRLNEEWSKFTPSLAIQMTVIGPVAEKFKLNTEYMLTFEEK